MNTHALTTMAVAAVLATTGWAAITPGHNPTNWPANAARHTIKITRAADTPEAKRMIAAGEAAPPGTNLWWSGERCGVKVVCAITADAVKYYEDMVKENQGKSWQTHIEPGSSIEYEAGVKNMAAFTLAGQTYSNVCVVTLKLTVNANFTGDAFMGIQIKNERTVVLDDKGAVCAIEGDGKAEELVMAI